MYLSPLYRSNGATNASNDPLKVFITGSLHDATPPSISVTVLPQHNTCDMQALAYHPIPRVLLPIPWAALTHTAQTRSVATLSSLAIRVSAPWLHLPGRSILAAATHSRFIGFPKEVQLWQCLHLTKKDNTTWLHSHTYTHATSVAARGLLSPTVRRFSVEKKERNFKAQKSERISNTVIKAIPRNKAALLPLSSASHQPKPIGFPLPHSQSSRNTQAHRWCSYLIGLFQRLHLKCGCLGWHALLVKFRLRILRCKSISQILR